MGYGTVSYTHLDVYKRQPLNLPAETLNFFNLNSWEEITDVDRSPVEVKDYTLTKSSISSNAFFSRRTKPRIRSGSSSPISPSSPVSSTNTFTSSKGKTYKLQTLDEFFSDIPPKPSRQKKIVIEEESETENSSQESSDYETEEGTDEESQDETEEE